MRIIKHELSVLIVFVLGMHCLTAAPDLGTGQGVFSEFSSALATLEHSYPNRSPSFHHWGSPLERRLKPIWTRMEQSHDELRRLSESYPPTDEYKESMKAMSEALNSLAAEIRHASESDLSGGLLYNHAAKVCEAVDKDLQIKVHQAKNNSNASANGPFKNVTVSVKTFHDTKEVGGCEVWYVPVAWEDVASRHRRFPDYSSPTTKPLAPGYYTMWTEYQNLIGKKEPVSIGESGAKDNVDLPAPE